MTTMVMLSCGRQVVDDAMRVGGDDIDKVTTKGAGRRRLPSFFHHHHCLCLGKGLVEFVLFCWYVHLSYIYT